MSGGDAAPVPEATEHDLDAVVAFASALVVFDWHGMGFSTRNAGLDAILLKRVPEPLGIIAPVCQHPLRLRQVLKQGRRTNVIADMAGRDEKAQGAAVCIGDGVKLDVHTALGQSDQAAEIPFFTPTLEAVR